MRRVGALAKTNAELEASVAQLCHRHEELECPLAEYGTMTCKAAGISDVVANKHRMKTNAFPFTCPHISLVLEFDMV